MSVLRLPLAARVSLAASGAVVVLLAIHTAAAGRAIAAQVAAWERDQVAGVAHHIAEMVEGMPAAEAARAVASASEGLAPFGVEISFSLTESETGANAGQVPVAAGVVTARSLDDLSGRLRHRLERSSLLLGAGLVVGLLVAIQASVHWGVVRPLARLRRQLRLMAQGPWHIEAGSGGVPEIEELARQIEGLGASLERSIGAWVAAERRGAAECARLELRRRLRPAVRQINLNASVLLAAGDLPPRSRRAVRRLLEAVDALRSSLGEPIKARTRPVAPGRDKMNLERRRRDSRTPPPPGSRTEPGRTS